jgi:hypothetical protein
MSFSNVVISKPILVKNKLIVPEWLCIIEAKYFSLQYKIYLLDSVWQSIILWGTLPYGLCFFPLSMQYLIINLSVGCCTVQWFHELRTLKRPNLMNIVHGTLCRSWLYCISSPYVHSRVDYNTFTMGKPMPESTLSPSQGLRIWPVLFLNTNSVSLWWIEMGVWQYRGTATHKRGAILRDSSAINIDYSS